MSDAYTDAAQEAQAEAQADQEAEAQADQANDSQANESQDNQAEPAAATKIKIVNGRMAMTLGTLGRTEGDELILLGAPMTFDVYEMRAALRRLARENAEDDDAYFQKVADMLDEMFGFTPAVSWAEAEHFHNVVLAATEALKKKLKQTAESLVFTT